MWGVWGRVIENMKERFFSFCAGAGKLQASSWEADSENVSISML